MWLSHLLKLKWFVYCRKWFIFKIALCNARVLFENLVHATWNFRYSAPILPFLFRLPTKLIKGWVLFLLSLLCSWLHWLKEPELEGPGLAGVQLVLSGLTGSSMSYWCAMGEPRLGGSLGVQPQNKKGGLGVLVL